ncbi:hypothetical protein KEJ19_04775 [Candidatus Bathyarchaeota archaeon]|nr:hypothetical protein [Candidatus Bathyarchaeota archaeon]
MWMKRSSRRAPWRSPHHRCEKSKGRALGVSFPRIIKAVRRAVARGFRVKVGATLEAFLTLQELPIWLPLKLRFWEPTM